MTAPPVQKPLLSALALWLAVAGCDSPTDGRDGEDGAPSLVTTTPEPAGANCPHGGFRVTSGVDADQDDTLDPSEVTATTYLCNGSDGGDGEEGLVSLIRVTPVLAGDECAAGGFRIEIGLDADRSGTLDNSEVTASATQYVCNGVSAACSVGRELAITGDYVDADGAEHWLRVGVGATTYALVPPGEPDPSVPPRLFEVVRVCADMDRVILRGDEGQVESLDYATGDQGLRVCRRGAIDVQAAIDLPEVDFASAEFCTDGEFATLNQGVL